VPADDADSGCILDGVTHLMGLLKYDKEEEHVVVMLEFSSPPGRQQ
jgi:hypothetical protein